jgi:acyl dehydratase
VAIPASTPGWWFEDAEPGRLLRHPGGRTVGLDEQLWLAWLSNNSSDVHGNLAWAARTAFGGPLVLGALTVAIVAGLGQPGEWPPERIATHVPAGWTRILLTAAIRPGATVHAESRIVAAEPFADGTGGLVRRVLTGRDEAGVAVVELEEERPVPARGPGTKVC